MDMATAHKLARLIIRRSARVLSETLAQLFIDAPIYATNQIRHWTTWDQDGNLRSVWVDKRPKH